MRTRFWSGHGDFAVSRLWIPLAIAAAVFVLAGCGSSSSSSSSSSAPSSSAAASSEASSSSSGASSSGGSMSFSAAAQHFAAFTGGKAGTAASGAPIMIGWINDQGAVPTFPEATQAVQAAVSLVNQQLGGADGRPIQLVTCFPLTETQGQSCADKFLNNSNVKLILDGIVPIGSASFMSTIGGKKTILESGPITPNDATAKNAYSIGAGSFGGESDATYIIHNLKAKSVGILGESDDPASVAVVKSLKASLEAAGIKVTEGTYTSTTSNLLPALTATGGNKNDAIYMNAVSPPNCIAAAKAAKQ